MEKIQTQRDCFIEEVRELECDEDEDRINETIKTIVFTEKRLG